MKRLPVSNPFDGSPVYYLPQTDSTMNDAVRLSAEGAKTGTVVVAGYQSAGRGRFVTRKWESAPGEGLLFTLMLDPSVFNGRVDLVPLLSGLGVANFVKKITGGSCLVKWPNDVVTGGGKVSGILCESRGNVVYIGIGINCLPLSAESPQPGTRTPQPAPPGTRTPQPAANPSLHRALPRVSLAQLGAARTAPLSILEEVLLSLKDTFVAEDPLEKISAKLYLKGRQVLVISGVPGTQEKISGTLEGLGSRGQLLVRETESGRLREIYSGELAVPGSR